MGMHWPCWACSIVAGAFGPVPLLSACGRLASLLQRANSKATKASVSSLFSDCALVTCENANQIRGAFCDNQLTGCLAVSPSNPSLPMGRCSHSLRWHTLSPRECELHQTDSLERRQSSEKKHRWTIYSSSCLDHRRVP